MTEETIRPQNPDEIDVSTEYIYIVLQLLQIKLKGDVPTWQKIGHDSQENGSFF